MNVTLEAVIYIVIGLLLCYLGYKFQKAVIALGWFLLGYRLVNELLSKLITDPKILLLIAILVGLLLACVGFKLEKIALFIAVAYFTYEAVGPFITWFEPIINLLIKVGIALIVGGFAVRLIRPILIVTTSFYGSSMLKMKLPTIIPSIPGIAVTVLFFVFLITGILTQLKTTK